MFFRQLLLGFFGFAAGGITSAGVFAFITAIGLVQRLAAKSGTAARVRIYEDCIIAGGTLGNLLFLYQFPLWGGQLLCALIGLSYGVFIGCLIMSLAETLDVFPILCRRLRLSTGVPWIVLSLALGKGLGSLLYYALGITSC